MNIIGLWLAAGVILIAAEVLGLSGIGMLFLGMGALTTGAIVELEWVAPDAILAQFTICFFSAVIWTALLWKAWKKYRKHAPQGHYSNIIGDTAYVGSSGLSLDGGGEVTWSGTIMRAELAKGAGISRLEAGTAVTISGMTGATLIVTPKTSVGA